jgi:glucose-1-phosphate cytidylyltransferase
VNVVILAGGLGTRLSEESVVKPKPMVEIGGIPILLHIMRLYARHGHTDFTIALGYKGEIIKHYFADYRLMRSDVTVRLRNGVVDYSAAGLDDWTVNLVDTGQASMTGGRIHLLESRLRPAGEFMATYGDGVADIDISALLRFHRQHGRLATITAVRPPARFGTMLFDGDRVTNFEEKPQTGEGWINGGFFVFEPGVFDYMRDESTVLEREPLERLARDGQLMAYRHFGFWHAMDTIRDRDYLNERWVAGDAPWHDWKAR